MHDRSGYGCLARRRFCSKRRDGSVSSAASLRRVEDVAAAEPDEVVSGIAGGEGRLGVEHVEAVEGMAFSLIGLFGFAAVTVIVAVFS